ncbi:hypothetical protein Sp245p_25780 (plasmid) [Azospirillum baldaniorum]|nr:hypothetical protein Sp245p_25780 [Azospirillum baldaniorum]
MPSCPQARRGPGMSLRPRPIHPRQTGRICGSSVLVPVIDLGPQVLQGVFAKPGRAALTGEAFPMRLVRCGADRDPGACGLLQTSASVPPKRLYRTYWYRSGLNATMRDHLRGIAEQSGALAGRRRRCSTSAATTVPCSAPTPRRRRGSGSIRPTSLPGSQATSPSSTPSFRPKPR